MGTDRRTQDCKRALKTLSAKAAKDRGIGVYVLYPNEAQREEGDHGITCDDRRP